MGFLDWLIDRPYAMPGPWYGSYNRAWHAAHPGAWQRGELEPGSFGKGDVWSTTTPEWDREWFRENDMLPPRQLKRVEPKNGGIRIGTLQPGESVAIPIKLAD